MCCVLLLYLSFSIKLETITLLLKHVLHTSEKTEEEEEGLKQQPMLSVSHNTCKENQRFTTVCKRKPFHPWILIPIKSPGFHPEIPPPAFSLSRPILWPRNATPADARGSLLFICQPCAQLSECHFDRGRREIGALASVLPSALSNKANKAARLAETRLRHHCAEAPQSEDAHEKRRIANRRLTKSSPE